MMSGEIKRIDSIKNMAVFQDFCWASSVRDKGNNVAEFKKINILYARNYAGKTTLSRIIRALEIGSVSNYKYDSPEFQLSFENGDRVTQHSLNQHGQVVRVFNEDFVEDNLSFIVNDEQTIKSFAILGEDNTKLEQEVEKHEAELGSKEDKTGLLREFIDSEEKFNSCEKAHSERSESLEKKLRDKANKEIKHNKVFGYANYTLPRIKEDIALVAEDLYTKLSNEQVSAHHAFLKEESKNKIKKPASFDLKYSVMVSKAKGLIEKKIQASDPIKELLNDAALATWVRTGREYHKDKRDKCAFCGSELPGDLWEKMDNHFNQESEELRRDLDGVLTSIEREQKRIPNLLKIRNSDFYSTFSQDLDALEEQFSAHSTAYCETLERIRKQLEQRKSDIFTPLIFNEPTSVEKDPAIPAGAEGDEAEPVVSMPFVNLDHGATIDDDSSATGASPSPREGSIDPDPASEKSETKSPAGTAEKDLNASWDSYEALRKKSNDVTLELQTKQTEAREALRLHEVFTFITDIKYADECKNIKIAKNTMKETKNDKTTKIYKVKTKRKKISDLKAQLKDESKGADQVNDYLNNFFGHQFLSLKAIEEASGDVSSGYRFEVTRNGKKAFHLSEGERNLIAFCYFMAKLEDIETKGNQPIIWIDDPVSSLDANHIFFVYSLINAVIVKPKSFLQLFISTHSLNFLKYLKRLSCDYKGKGVNKVKILEFFLIERFGESSRICLMPDYLKKYVTEFNYLFHQIYKCAIIESVEDKNYRDFYNFGNNARKFLEIYLYYKYPNGIDTSDKLLKFFGEDRIPAILIDRVNNEYSHLCGGFERGALPIEVPEMRTAAQQIILKIKEDTEQYSALLQSIDVKDDLLEKITSTPQET
jgi:wobble nucleotide-excising tRNase